MHIKEAYQRRIKHQQSSPNKTVKLDHTTVIGSIHTGQVNYQRKQPFFMDYKVRDEVKQAKQFVKIFKDKDVLELRDKQWNASTTSPKRFDDFEKEESHKSKLLKIRMGFSDFSPLKEKSNKIYEGTESRNNYAGWNVSTYFDRKQKSIGEEFTNLSALDNTMKYNKSKLTNYKTLQERYADKRELQKQELMNSSDILQDFKSSYLFSNPSASPEKTFANVHKMFEQSKREKLKLSLNSQNDTIDSLSGSGNFKAKLSPTQRTKMKYIHYHTGKWQKIAASPKKQLYLQIESEQQNEGYSWSCCQSDDKQGKGCAYRVQDGNKMNLVGFDYA